MKKLLLVILIFVSLTCLTGCGRKAESPDPKYEIVDGQIVEITVNSPGVNETDDVIMGFDETYQAGGFAGTVVDDGVAMNFSEEEYNSIEKADASLVSEVKDTINAAAEACKNVYSEADKGQAINVDISGVTIAEMVSAIGSAGIPAVDSDGNCNMACYEAVNDFGKSIYSTDGSVRCTYVVVYPDGHLSAFCLNRESGTWYLIAVSGDWQSNNKLRIFSEGRYSVGGVSYTDKGWLIYSRNTNDFDDNQKANTDAYTMVRVLPYDSNKKYLCDAYIKPIGYLENNLFTVDWSYTNFGPVDFNSLYAYLFKMYYGCDMLSSYNVRSYYKAVGGTRLYLVPTDTFETVTQTWFDIDGATLKSISDFSYKFGGYFFLGYNRDYYNVTPRTPLPEVVDYKNNSDGSITMTVDAVNPWYGTDCAFRHIVTVMPTQSGFKFISNDIIESEDNILPEQKLSLMLDVEKDQLG